VAKRQLDSLNLQHLPVYCVCVWMLTRVAQTVTAEHRDLYSCVHKITNQKPGQPDLLDGSTFQKATGRGRE